MIALPCTTTTNNFGGDSVIAIGYSYTETIDLYQALAEKS